MPPPELPPDHDVVARQHRALLLLVQLDKSDLGLALPRILALDAGALAVARVSYWRFADARSRLVCEGHFDATGAVQLSSQHFTREALPRYFAALHAERCIAADDAVADARTQELSDYFAAHGITSVLHVPVRHRGRVAGVLCHEQVGPARRWAPPEIDFAVAVAGMTAVGLDLHARRRAETRYELLTTALQDLVWEWDLRTDEISWTPVALTMLGFEPSAVEPSLDWWKGQVHPDDLSRVLDSLAAHAAQGQGVWRDEYRFRKGDGAWAIIMDRGVLERSADGVPIRMVGAMVDVTEQRRLESRVAVSDRMASVGTLAAGVAHEINNPLTYIHGNLTFALKSIQDVDVRYPQVHQALSESLTGVERVQRIVRDLKAFSRPDEQPSHIDVREVVRAALNIAQNEIRHRARLRESHEPLPPVLGNASRLGQVVLNLLVNAAQAIPDGNAANNEIVVRTLHLPDGKVRIEVEDTGVGLTPELSTRIFDPFFTTKPVGEGTGLGLTICHAIVTALGGTLSLENNPGRGARARVDLVAAPTSGLQGCASATGAPTQSARRGRVLIIDDTPNVGNSMKRLLQEEHEVDCTTRGREVLEALANGRRWDVILCDLMMPELNGMEFVAAVEQLDPTILPQVVIMSGGAFTRQGQDFLRSWPHGQLEKPIDSDTLFEEIRRRVDAVYDVRPTGSGR